MNGRLVWGLVLGMMTIGVAWAGEKPARTPTSATPTATPNFTPWPTSTPLVAPTWAPESAGPVPESMKPKKPSPWMSSVGIGMGLPMSGNLGTAYTTGFNLDLGSGLKVTNNFSLWLDFDLDLFNSRNDTLTQGNNFTLIEAAFWGRYRFLDSDVSPYIFAGPGLSYNENRSDGGALYDANTGQGYIPINAYEIDLLAEGGLGLEMRLGGGLHTFLQGKLTYDFTSPHFAEYGFTDSPVIVVPLEVGMMFGI